MYKDKTVEYLLFLLENAMFDSVTAARDKHFPRLESAQTQRQEIKNEILNRVVKERIAAIDPMIEILEG